MITFKVHLGQRKWSTLVKLIFKENTYVDQINDSQDLLLTGQLILHYTTIKINTKIYANNIQDNHQDLYQDHIKIYAKITITYSMTSNIYTNIEAHILRSKMNSIHERHVPSQEKPKSMNDTFLKITRWRNNRQTKRNSISFHHISLTTRFPTS